MSWAWVRPADPSLLEGRPLLDLGTGDGRILNALAGSGFVVGIDKNPALLEPGGVNAEAGRLPFRDESFETVLAADLFHHLDDGELSTVLREIRRVLKPTGRLVAWWYEHTSDPSPDAPRHVRTLDALAPFARDAGLLVNELAVHTAVPSSPTVAIVATR